MSVAELDRIELAWERLASDRNAVTDFAYARAWAAGLDGAQRLNVMVAGGADARAIAPLVINRDGGWLTLLAAEMYEILDFPHADEDAVWELARAIVRTGAAARFEAHTCGIARGGGHRGGLSGTRHRETEAGGRIALDSAR